MSDESKKWKTGLLASGFPLEFEAAKILVANGFTVDADYTYEREGDGVSKDFSVDIVAQATFPFGSRRSLKGGLELLVECKHRMGSTKWLFLPEVNPPDCQTYPEALKYVDSFSPWVTSRECRPLRRFDLEMPWAYKGIEVKSDGSAYDGELRHGIMQLQYALPSLVARQIGFSASWRDDDGLGLPFAFSAILLTNAELFVLSKDASIETVQNADCVADLGKSVPFLTLRFECAPEFERHCVTCCDVLESSAGKFKESDDMRKRIDKYGVTTASRLCDGLMKGYQYPLSPYFTSFVVCTLPEFPRLIDRLKRAVTGMVKTQKLLRDCQPKG